MCRQDTMDFLGVLMAAAPQAAAGSALGPILDHFSNMLATPARAASITSQSLPRLHKVSTASAFASTCAIAQSLHVLQAVLGDSEYARCSSLTRPVVAGDSSVAQLLGPSACSQQASHPWCGHSRRSHKQS